MKNFLILFLLVLAILPGNAQITDVLRDLFVTDTTVQTDFSVDSIRLIEIQRELNEARTNEANLRMEMEQMRLATFSLDSLKLAQQKHRIDSLRNVTPGMPVVIKEDTLYQLFAKWGGHSPQYRANYTREIVLDLGKRYNLKPDSLYLESTEVVTDIMYGDKVIASFSDQDGLWENTSRDELAERARLAIREKLHELKEEHSLLQLGKRVLYFVLVILVQYFLFRFTAWLYKYAKFRIHKLRMKKLKPISFKEYEFFDVQKQVNILVFLVNVIRYSINIILLVLTVPILFSIFPQTEALARQIFSYLWNPVRSIIVSVIDYIPNLFTIVVIWFAIRYVIKGVQYLANEIEVEKLKISGFYPDWAQPTFQIVRFLLYAFMIAMIYPHLPGSDSGVFQGISVFVGLIISLGSSTVIGNVMAGLVITYMRPFRMGDRIKLNDTTGNVVEKTPFVTRLKTPKNEIVTIPNSFIMSSHTVNYSASARDYGLIIHTEVTVEYEISWRKVHQLLIDAALQTDGVVTEPQPFVLETSLSDTYTIYQVNAYIRDADKLAQIYSNLHQSIQDVFGKAGLDLCSPQYIVTRDENGNTIPLTQLQVRKG